MGRPQKTIQEIRDFIGEEGYILLPGEYENRHSRLAVQCNNGHIWNTFYNDFRSGSRCPACNNGRTSKKTIEYMRALAELQGGKCLSEVYVNANEVLLWECKLKHNWETSYHSIKNGSWCPECVGNKKLSISNAKIYAESKEGICLSNENDYINNHAILVWQCNEGHMWKASLANVKSGSWCPKCAKEHIYRKELYECKSKICSKCNVEKPATDENFPMRRGKAGLYCDSICKKCIYNMHQQPEYKLKQITASTIRGALKKQAITTHGRTILDSLPYTINDLKNYIENKFDSWMNWKNWGKYIKSKWDDNDYNTWKWQIDHIVPHSLFKYATLDDPDFKKCWSLDNLRPLSAKANLLKGKKCA